MSLIAYSLSYAQTLIADDLYIMPLPGCSSASDCATYDFTFNIEDPDMAYRFDYKVLDDAGALALASGSNPSTLISGMSGSNLQAVCETSWTPPSSAGEQFYLVATCNANGVQQGCGFAHAIKETSSCANCADRCKVPGELFTMEQTQVFMDIESSMPDSCLVVNGCGTGGCTDIKYSFTTMGYGYVDEVYSVDRANYVKMQNGEAFSKYVGWTGLQSATDTVCASENDGLSTPSGEASMFICAKCDPGSGTTCDITAGYSYKKEDGTVGSF